MGTYLLAIDQGTTGSTAMLLDRSLAVVAKANHEFAQIYPQPGWVEHDPKAILVSVEAAIRDTLAAAGASGDDIAAIGITNQRETTVVWDRATSTPIHNAIVWQCRRTADRCRVLKADGHEDAVRAKTGLVLDPYFSGTKVAWILDRVEGARARAAAGDLAFGTIDTWVTWWLTGGDAHVTDVSNASRTLLMDLESGTWADALLELLDVPRAVLPTIVGNAEIVGHTRGLGVLPDGIPIAGMAGDQ